MPGQPVQSAIPVGTVLVGKYRVTREIGRGGMAAVYEAQNIDIGKRVAVKVLNAELTNSSVVVERFLREARAAAAVNSPYICDVYDAGRLEDGRPFLVLELLEGESLYEQMIKVRRFDPAFVAKIFGQIAKGLTKAHDANIIHRDLKPENIFLTTTDDGDVVAKILDFGLAKFYAPVSGTATQQRLTREGAIFGTPAYMSPEQVKGHGQVDRRSDLWAVGCMVYECLTGKTVWTTDSGVAMIFAQVATAPLPMPSRLRPDLPPTFDRWFARALERDPNKRFQTSRELAEELTVALGQASTRIGQSLEDRPSAASAVSALPSMDVQMAFAPTQPPMPLPGMPPNSPPLPISLPKPALPPIAPPPPKLSRPGTGQSLNRPSATGPGTPPNISISTTSSTKTSQEDSALHMGAPPNLRGAAALRWSVGGAVGVALVGLIAWRTLVRTSSANHLLIPSSSASTSASSSSSARPEVSASAAHLPKWVAALQNAQELLTKGEGEAALKGFREATDTGGGPAARAVLEQAKTAVGAKGLCKLTALGHPRPFDMFKPKMTIGRPTIAHTPSGTLAVWTDDHEVQGQVHAYSQLLDSAFRPVGSYIDVTPEAAMVQEPRLLVADDRVVLTYGDAGGTSPGLFARVLDSTGRLTMPRVQLTDSRPSAQSFSLAKGTIGEFWVAFVDDRDKDSSDVFLHKILPGVRPAEHALRATNFAGKIGFKTRARTPVIAVSGNNVNIVFRVEDGRDHWIARQRIPQNDPGLVTGLLDTKDKITTKDRFLGELKPVTEKKVGGAAPSLVCDGAACFFVWRDDPRGASVAFFDPASGNFIWRKKFSQAATQVSVAVDGSGRGLVAWLEPGRMLVAPVTRDGMGEPPSVIGRVFGDQPKPEVAAATADEWLVAWNNVEGGYMGTYSARVTCR